MVRFMCQGVLAVLVLTEVGISQTTGNSSISGRVVAEDGRALRAIVTAQPVTNPGSAPTASRRAFSPADGSFAFPQLPAGTYGLCAQVPGEQARQRSQPFLDACQWSVLQNVQVAAGQVLADIQLVAPTGALLQIRVDDPDKVLPMATAPAALTPVLELMVSAQSRLFYHVPVASQDAAGRNYAIIVPFNMPLSLSAKSSQASLFDVAGRPAQAVTPLQYPSGFQPPPIKITIRRGN